MAEIINIKNIYATRELTGHLRKDRVTLRNLKAVHGGRIRAADVIPMRFYDDSWARIEKAMRRDEGE